MALLVGALLLAACSGGDAVPADPRGVVEEPVGDETSATPVARELAQRTVARLDGTEGDVTLPPSDLLAVVDEGVEQGRWRRGEGVAAALRTAVGGEEPVDLLRPVDLGTVGLTALTRTAGDLLEDPSTPQADKEALTEALSHVVASSTFLDRTSAPADHATPTRTSPAGDHLVHAAPVVGAPATDGASGALLRPVATADQCEAISTEGFDDDLDLGGVCYLHEERVLDGHRLRVHFPAFWADREEGRALVGLTLDALGRSTDVLGRLATVGDVTAVFSVRESSTDALASQMYFDLDGPCPVTIFPAAFLGDPDDYQQTIAHEVAHCVQDRTFASTSPYATHAWWLEGSAEWLSNVVYPRTNDEHRWTEPFDLRSRHEPLFSMRYENTVFFQYLANRLGDRAVIDLLEAVAAGGAGPAALADVPEIDQLFQDMVVAAVADAVVDPGGGTVGGFHFASSRHAARSTGDAPGSVADPFVATRLVVTYDEGRRFGQSLRDTGVLHAAVEKGAHLDPAAWTTLPPVVLTGCDEPVVYLLVGTTVDEARGLYADVEDVTPGPCDPCLVGAWELRLESFSAYMQAVFDEVGGLPSGVEVTIEGHYYLAFDEFGELRAVRQPLVIGVHGLGGTVPPSRIDGEDRAEYRTDGTRLIVGSMEGSASAALGGISVGPFGTDGDGDQLPYECDEELLTIEDPQRGALVLDRIEAIPEPDAVEVRTGSRDG